MINVDPIPDFSKDLAYGHEVSLKFKVTDTISKQNVLGTSDTANVYLSLKHPQAGRTRAFTSVHQPAAHYVEGGKAAGFHIKWPVSANAVKGAGVLALEAQDADGNRLPINKEKQKKEVEWKVNIGGDITVTKNVFTSSKGAETAVVAEFSLTSQSRKLKDAQLRSTVQFRESPEASWKDSFQAPVATNNEGVYEVSWSNSLKQTPAGEYKIQVFREVDRLRAAENREFLEKKKGESGSEDLHPLLEINVEVEGAQAGSSIPLKTEFLAVVLISAAFYFVNERKNKYFSNK